MFNFKSTKAVVLTNITSLNAKVELDILHQNVPDCYDMADTTSQYKEMEDRMHILALVDTIEYSTCNIAYALGNNPNDRSWGDRINERLESNQHRKSHANETNGFQIAVILQSAKTHNCSGYCTRPDKTEQTPAPITLIAHSYERDGRIRTCNMPIDGSMIPFAQSLFPLAPCRESMIHSRCNIRHKHTKEIKYHSCRCPTVVIGKTPIQENNAYDDSQKDATSMRPGIPKFLLMTEMYLEFHNSFIVLKI